MSMLFQCESCVKIFRRSFEVCTRGDTIIDYGNSLNEMTQSIYSERERKSLINQLQQSFVYVAAMVHVLKFNDGMFKE